MIEDPILEKNEQGAVAESAVNEAPTDSAKKLTTKTDKVQHEIQAILLTLTSKEQLEDAIKKLGHTADSVRIMRESLPAEKEQRTRVLNFAADILLDGWGHNSAKSGTIATLLSQTWNDWQPTEEVIDQLVAACERAMKKGDAVRVATVQPLSYALGALGKLEFYGKWLETITRKTEWRKADLERNMLYYASRGPHPRENQLAAIERHLKDKNRTGLLRAHDIGLLYQIREEQLDEGRGSDDPEVVLTNNLLRETVDVLEAHKQAELVAYIREHRTI